MARRRQPPPAADEGGVPAVLLSWPSGAALDLWDDGEPMPVDYGFPESWWRRIRAEARWSAARRAWAAAHGLVFREVFGFRLLDVEVPNDGAA